jgi:hypothetical protein
MLQTDTHPLLPDARFLCRQTAGRTQARQACFTQDNAVSVHTGRSCHYTSAKQLLELNSAGGLVDSATSGMHEASMMLQHDCKCL